MPVVLTFLLAAAALASGRRMGLNPWPVGALLGLLGSGMVLHLGRLFPVVEPGTAFQVLSAVSAGPLLVWAGLEIWDWLEEGEGLAAAAPGMIYVLFTAAAGIAVAYLMLPRPSVVPGAALFMVAFGPLAPHPRPGVELQWRVGSWMVCLLVLAGLALLPSRELSASSLPWLAGKWAIRSRHPDQTAWLAEILPGVVTTVGLVLIAGAYRWAQPRLTGHWPEVPWLCTVSDLILGLGLPTASTLVLGSSYPGWIAASIGLARPAVRAIAAPDAQPFWRTVAPHRVRPAWRLKLPELAGTLLATSVGLALDPDTLGDSATWSLAATFLVAAALARFFQANRLHREEVDFSWRPILPAGLVGLVLMQVAFTVHSYPPGLRAATLLAWTALEWFRPRSQADSQGREGLPAAVQPR